MSTTCGQSFSCCVLVSVSRVSLCVGVQPVAVLLCPGWEKAQLVSELLEELKVNQSLHSMLVLLGLGEDEAQAFRIPRNCESTSSGLASHTSAALVPHTHAHTHTDATLAVG